MADISCGECARYINFERCPCPMDECIAKGYKHFLDPHTLPDKFCCNCGQRLTKPRSKNPSGTYEYTVVELVCPAGCKKRYLHKEIRETS